MFLFGSSFGGLLVSNMAAGLMANAMFSGAVSFIPFYRLGAEKLYRYEPLLKILDVVHPNKTAPKEHK